MPDPAEQWGFGISYGLGLILVWILTWLARRPHRASLPTPLPELSLERLAYLHGGAIRVAEAVLAKMLQDRMLRAGKPPGISEEDARSAPTVRPDDRKSQCPATEMYEVAAKAAAVPIAHEELLNLVKKSPEMTSVVDGLRGRGLIDGKKTWALLRRWGPTVLISTLVVQAGARLGNDATGSATWWTAAPGWEKVTVVLIVLAMWAAFATVVSWWATAGSNEYAYLTPAGLALVRALRRGRSRPTDNLVAPVAAHYKEELRGPAGVVALRGLNHHPDPEVQRALYRPPRPPSREGHSGT